MHNLDLCRALIVRQGKVTVRSLCELDSSLNNGLAGDVNHFFVVKRGTGKYSALVKQLCVKRGDSIVSFIDHADVISDQS